MIKHPLKNNTQHGMTLSATKRGDPLPRRCETDIVDNDGSCLACDAINGELCLKPRRKT